MEAKECRIIVNSDAILVYDRDLDDESIDVSSGQCQGELDIVKLTYSWSSHRNRDALNTK